jgi:sialic acid synthase SpsE
MGKLSTLLSNPQKPDYYLIGETAYHHTGDYTFMKKMVDDLCGLGVDAIKFHIMLAPDEFMTPAQVEYEEIKSWLFPVSKWDELLEYTRGKGVEIIVLADEAEAMRYVNDNCDRLGIEGLEIHAASLNDRFMLEEINRFLGVRILGIGGSPLDDISYAIQKIEDRRRDNLLLMHGIQTYPTDYRKIKLGNIAKLKDLFGCEVGYADHTSFDSPHNAFVTAAGFVAGARVIEKHYSFQPGVDRNDFEAAAGAETFKDIIAKLKLCKEIMGDGALSLNDAEAQYGKIGIGKKGLVARDAIRKGVRLSPEMVAYKLTNESSFMSQSYMEFISDFVVVSDMAKDEIIDFNKVRREPQPK